MNKEVFPLLHATVIRLINKNKIPTPEQFTNGKLVNLRKDSKYSLTRPELLKETGNILAPDPDLKGWVIVEFQPSGYKNRYRIGDPDVEAGARDLDLHDSEMSHVVVSLGGQFLEFPIDRINLNPGDIVKIDKSKKNIIDVEKAIASGKIAFVSRIISDDLVEIDCEGGKRAVFSGKFSGKLEDSDRVTIDSTETVIIYNHGVGDSSFSVENPTGVSWSDIYGQDEAIRKIRNAINPSPKLIELNKAYKRKQQDNFLLWGTPGNGKTMLAKAAYTEMVSMLGDTDAPVAQGFILVSGSEILEKYVGVAEATIKHIFARARKFYEKYGIRALIVIDECEAILRKRGSGKSSDVSDTIVPAFLAEMDGVRKSRAIVMLITNRPHIIDGAVMRPGRVDTKIEVIRPDKDAAKKIFMMNINQITISNGTDSEKLSQYFVDEIFSEKYAIYNITKGFGDVEKTEQVSFGLSQIISAAMIVNIAQKAKDKAIMRDIEKGDDDVSGISQDDVVLAIKDVYHESFAQNHDEAFGEFTEYFADQISNVKQVQIQA